MPRSVWQDLAAIQGRTPRVCLPADDGPGREIIYPGILHPAPTEHLSYDVTDFLQVEGDMVLACPADLETNSAALRYALDTAFDGERIHEGPPTYTGPRATRPFIGKLIPYPNEIAGGHRHSRGAA